MALMHGVLAFYVYVFLFCCINLSYSLRVGKIHGVSVQKAFFRRSETLLRSSRDNYLVDPEIRGKVVVSGIGEADEDEFMLELLNQQQVWDSVVLATPSASVAKRRFLSRTARYSGLLNILEFAEADVTNPDQMQGILQGANAWVAFNVQQYLVPDLSHAAANAGVKRVIMTTPLPAVQCGEGGTHNLPEFIAARELFAAQGGSFTGIRHGEIVPGSEDNPYIIVNASVPVVMERVERGVLARAVGEMLRMTVTFNQDCGISSCNKFSSMYLDILRKTGLTRREEVFKMFQSGLIDLAQRLLNDMEGNVQVATKPIDDKEDSEEFLLEMRKFRAISMLKDSDDDLTEEQKEMKTLYGDTEDDKQLIEKRTQQILENAYQFYSTNKLTESTASWVFVDKNYEKAKALAKKEIYAARAEKSMRSLRRTSQAVSIDRVIDAQEKQYARLLSLERKEMLIQVEMWEIWVKYFSMLIPITAKYCKDNSISFSKLPEFEQSVLVMTLCNRLRETVGLPEYDNIYDATDAREIVERTSAMPKGEELNSMDAREAAASLLDQYGNAFTFPIFRKAHKIIKEGLAILERGIPEAPLPAESKATPTNKRQSSKRATYTWQEDNIALL